MSYHAFGMASDDERYPDYNDDSRSNNFEPNAYDSEEGKERCWTLKLLRILE